MSNYSVNLWGSNPDEMNDDCWMGQDFDSENEALRCFNHPEEFFSEFDLDGTRFVELTSNVQGNDLYDTREIQGSTTSDDSDWTREMAMEAGMGFGCDGYNDFYGY